MNFNALTYKLWGQFMYFSSNKEVRDRIVQTDSELVKIIAQRARCVEVAAVFKTYSAAVLVPERVEQVIVKKPLRQDFLTLLLRESIGP